MKYKSKIWKCQSSGKWLVYRERHTHTGHHQDISFTDDINKATELRMLPRQLMDEGLKPVVVTIERTVTIG